MQCVIVKTRTCNLRRTWAANIGPNAGLTLKALETSLFVLVAVGMFPHLWTCDDERYYRERLVIYLTRFEQQKYIGMQSMHRRQEGCYRFNNPGLLLTNKLKVLIEFERNMCSLSCKERQSKG